jgi:hypothetical protein
MMKFTFTSFETEIDCDYLKIYNGSNTSAPLIGSYSGLNSPGIVEASNIGGALTHFAAQSCLNVKKQPVF